MSVLVERETKLIVQVSPDARGLFTRTDELSTGIMLLAGVNFLAMAATKHLERRFVILSLPR